MYVAPESKLLVNLANVTTASVEEEEFTFEPPCA